MGFANMGEPGEQSRYEEGNRHMRPLTAEEMRRDTLQVRVGYPNGQVTPSLDMRDFLEGRKLRDIEAIRDPEVMRGSLLYDINSVGDANTMLAWIGSSERIPEPLDMDPSRQDLTEEEWNRVKAAVDALSDDDLQALIQKSLQAGLAMSARDLTYEYKHPDEMPEEVKERLKKVQSMVHNQAETPQETS